MNYQKNKVYIVEDVSVIRMMLEQCMEENGFEVVGSSPSAEDAWEDINNIQIDLILLDIQLVGERNGIWLGGKIDQKLKIPFIYITANQDHKTSLAVMATNPVGFIIKPINIIQLITTAKIALNQNQNNSKKQLLIQDGLKSISLTIDDIYYFQSEGNYLHIYLENSHFLIRSTLDDFLDKLPKENFLRIHQRNAFNIEKRFVYTEDHINILNTSLSVSTKYKKELKYKLHES